MRRADLKPGPAFAILEGQWSALKTPKTRKTAKKTGANKMTNLDTDYQGGRRSAGMAWLYMPIVLILFLGAALSVAAYNFSDVDLTVAESIGAGFGGLAGIILGLFGAAIGIVVGLFGALIGLVAAGGAVAMTLFIVGSPIIAIILIALLWRRSKQAPCPDPGAHPAA